MILQSNNDEQGIFWVVWSLDEEMKEWLSRSGIACPDGCSRLPTGLAIKSVLRELEEYDVSMQGEGGNQAWQAEITPKKDAGQLTRALLGISCYSGDDCPQELHFVHAEEQVVVYILSKLARWCGPLVAIPDTGAAPIVVSRPLPVA